MVVLTVFGETVSEGTHRRAFQILFHTQHLAVVAPDLGRASQPSAPGYSAGS